MDEKLIRVIDANCNRTREGLRVIEEIGRFWLDNEDIFLYIKNLRHKFTDLEKNIRQALKNGTFARESDIDVGKMYLPDLETDRRDIVALAEANCRRVEESLRVLEEFLKLGDAKFVKFIKEMRFEVYTMEKKLKDELLP